MTPSSTNRPQKAQFVSSDSLFMSREKHAQITTYTTLLARLDAYLMRNHAGDARHEQRGSQRSTHEFLESTYVRPLVRSQENLALVVSSNPRGPKLTWVPLSTQARAPSGPRPRDEADLGSLCAAVDGTRLTAVAPAASTGLGTTSDSFDSVLHENVKHSSRGTQKIPLHQHVGYYHHLLRECHNATDEDAREDTKDHLKRYAYLASYPKIFSKLRKGLSSCSQLRDADTTQSYVPCADHWDKTDRNLYDVLVHYAYPEAGHSDASIPTKGLTEAQLYWLCSFWAQSGQPKESLAKMTIYGCANARRVFRYMLSRIVARAGEGLGDVHDRIQADKVPAKESVAAQSTSEAVAEIRELVVDAD